MVFPFGVSVSDFISGLKLFKDALDALSKTHSARADYAELSRSLSSLRLALETVGKVKLDTPQHIQALDQTLRACKLCLSNFLVEIAKFRTLDAQYATKARLVMLFRQVQWGICRKDDVRKFRAEVETHVAALEMLMIAFQVWVLASSSLVSDLLIL